MTDLHVSVWDHRMVKVRNAPPILFVHGSGATSAIKTFEKQRPLAKHYKLLLLDRRGFGGSPGVKKARGDFADDASDIVELLEEHCEEEGAHVVGHSYGAIGSMLAASERPKLIRSLTVIEPPAFHLARNHHQLVDELIERLELNFSRARDSETNMSPHEYWREFTQVGGFEPPTIEFFARLSEEDIKGIRTSMTERPPWEADIPFEKLANSHFAKLVVSGGWKEAPPSARQRIGAAYILVCEILQAKLRAEWAVFEKADHSPQQLGEPFNEKLMRFLDAGN